MSGAKTRTTDDVPPPGNGFTDLERTAIAEQLARIEQHSLFKDTTRMKRFLRYVVEETVAGRGHRLKGYNIGLEVFDRADDFDPQADTIVRVQAGQLRRRLDLYYAKDGDDDPVRIVIPKGRYRPSFEIRQRSSTPQNDNGLDLKPDDLHSPSALGSDQTESSVTELPLVTRRPPPAAADDLPAIAILTFDDLTSSDRNDFFAEGITAELVQALVQFRHIRVVALMPTVASRAKSIKNQQLAEELGVQFVLSGNVRRSGDLFRISVNLIVAATGELVFSKTFDRRYTPDNLFEIQESIASYVSAAIAAPFGSVNRYNRRRLQDDRKSINAYELVLRYYSLPLVPDQMTARSLLADAQALTQEHEEFSTGFAIQALLLVFLVTQCVPSADHDTTLAQARQMARRATAIDPLNALGYFASFQALYHSGHLVKAEHAAQRAMALNPNDYSMLAYYAVTRAFRGDQEGALLYARSAKNLTARGPKWFDVPAMIVAFLNGEYAVVDASVETLDRDTPTAFWCVKLSALGHLGKAKEIIDLLKQLTNDPDGFLPEIRHTFLAWQPCDEMSHRLFEGWRKGGLDI